jgi:beta-phosphoglucomutase-like phosphatase (HAD superfamily)
LLSPRSLWRVSRGVLFDFDGVLADSEPLFRETWNRVIEPRRPISEPEYFRRWSFLGEGEMHLREMGFSSREIAVLRYRQRALYSGLCSGGEVVLFPETRDLLEWVLRRKPCAIASNTDSDLVASVLCAGGVPAPTVVGGEGLRHKPDPDIFLRASSVLGIPPSECLVVEDAWKGVEAARRGGFPVLLVRTRHNRGMDAGSVPEVAGLSGLLSELRLEDER